MRRRKRVRRCRMRRIRGCKMRRIMIRRDVE